MTDFYVQKGHAGTDSGTQANPFLTIDQGFNAITSAGTGPHTIFIQTPIVDAGTTDSTTTNKLVDSSQNFLTTAAIGDTVRNTTDTTFATVTAVDSNTTLSLDADIMVSGETYDIFGTSGSGDYDELATIDTVGAFSAEIRVIGFDTTTDENPPVQIIINGSGSNNYGITTALTVNIHHVFRNIQIKNSTGDGFNLDNADKITFTNCTSDNHGGVGFAADNDLLFFQCTASNNTGRGINVGNIVFGHSSVISTNAGDGIFMEAGAFANTLFHGNITGGKRNIHQSAGAPAMVCNCTIDGENTGGGALGISSSGEQRIIVNNILYDLSKGFQSNTESGEMNAVGYNLVNSIPNPDFIYIGMTPLANTDVTGAPEFTDEANDDYTLASDSPAINAGTDPSNAP